MTPSSLLYVARTERDERQHRERPFREIEIAGCIRSPAITIAVVYLLGLMPSFPHAASAADAPPPPYGNHTVGGPAGWFFNATSNSSALNYSDWASSQSFFLGDFLIFNTDSNATVIQTYNATTYGLCSTADDDATDTFVYYDGSTNGGPATPLTVAVPLTVEGANYYFSDADDGIQCFRGMRFQITVAHGQGLPASLAQPPPSPPANESVASPIDNAGSNQGERFYNGSPEIGSVWGIAASAISFFVFAALF